MPNMEAESTGEWFVLAGATLLIFSMVFGLLETLIGLVFLVGGILLLALGLVVRDVGVRGWPPS